MRVLYIAEGPERQQIETLLTQAGAWVKRISPEFFEQNPRFDSTQFDLAIVAPVPGFERQIARLRDRFQDAEKISVCRRRRYSVRIQQSTERSRDG